MKKQTITLFEAFAGIGAQYQALKNIADDKKWDIKLVGMVEWFIPAIIGHYSIHFGKPEPIEINEPNIYIYIYSRISNDSKSLINNKTYEKINLSSVKDYLIASHKQCNNSFDINKTTWKNIPKNIDIFTYSFPCQDLSVQGKQKGMKKLSGSRSSLLWEIERLLNELKQNYQHHELPKYLLMENVSQVANNKNISELNEWQKSLNSLGYDSQLYMLNAKNFGLPQNRLRAFLLSVRKDFAEKMNFSFPDLSSPNIDAKLLSDILVSDKTKKLFLPELNRFKLSPLVITKSNIKRHSLIGYTKFNSEGYVYDPTGIGPTLTATGANSRIKILTKNKKIRKLSNLENFLYMGFTEKDYLAVSETNLINEQKQTFLCGNSICVQVLEAIFKCLKF